MITGYFLCFFMIAFGIVFGYILFQNEFLCSYCGKYKLGSDSWYRKGPYLHPENIVNECKSCYNGKSAKESKKKGWAKIEDKSDGPLSWTEYTDHDGYVYTMYDMMTNPATPGAYMFVDTEEKECKHEMVSTEYSSQPYGHCLECNRTVFRDEDNNWKL
jgi:hypothetical protein